jgi:hypothetical protein
MEACMDLMYLASQLDHTFSSRTNKKMAEKVISQLCLNQEEKFGTDILYEELCHLIRVYIMIALEDDSYRSILLQIFKMNDVRCKEKIKRDLKLFAVTIPETLGKEKEFKLFQHAIIDTQKGYL